jgi:hypothetical protein
MAMSLLQAHAAVADPHGDRAYADTTFATQVDVSTLSESVSGLGDRVTGIEEGTASLSALNVDGPVQVTNGDLSVLGTGKGYRFRRGGSALDLEATGVDLLVSNWSGTNFDGTQRSYDRYSADAMNVQHAGRREYVAALFSAAVHTIDPNGGGQLGFHGATPVGQQTVTGSRTDGTALASLLTALANLGLIVDETTT